MSLVGLNELLDHARRRRYAVGYFEGWEQYSLEAALEAAEEADSPIILGFGGAVVSQEWLDGRGLDCLAALAHCLASHSTVPVALLLNEARTFQQVLRALRAGCNAVMLDGSHLPLDENVALSRKVVEVAHALGAAVEGGLGRLADASDAHLQAVHTDPDEAASFVERTGVDALAVSVGNVHLLEGEEARIDLGLLESIQRAVPVPLVIHGGTGFPARAVRPAIERGVAKFNVGTRLKRAFLEGMRESLASLPDRPNVHWTVGSREDGDVVGQGRARMKAEIATLLELYGSAGRASGWYAQVGD